MKQRFHNTCSNRELTNSGIDALSDAIRTGLASVCKDQKDISRLCLSAEEAMLSWQERFGTEKTCRVTIAKRFRSVQILLEVEGEPGQRQIFEVPFASGTYRFALVFE